MTKFSRIPENLVTLHLQGPKSVEEGNIIRNNGGGTIDKADHGHSHKSHGHSHKSHGHGHSHGGGDSSAENMNMRGVFLHVLGTNEKRFSVTSTFSRGMKNVFRTNFGHFFMESISSVGDALGSVVVIISAVIMWQTDWEYKLYVDPGLSLVLVLIM